MQKTLRTLGFLLLALSLGATNSASAQSGKPQGNASYWTRYQGDVTLLYVRGARKDDQLNVKNSVRQPDPKHIELEFRDFKAGKMPGTMTLVCDGPLDSEGNFDILCSECVEFDMPLMPMFHYDAAIKGKLIDGVLKYHFELVGARVIGARMEVSYHYEGKKE